MHTRSTSSTAVAGAIILAAALFACKKSAPSTTGEQPTGESPVDTPPPEPPPPVVTNKTWNVGEKAMAPDYTMTIENVKECKTKYYFKPKKGNIKLGVEVAVEGTADKDVPVNPFYAKVTDGDGYSYTSTFGGCEPDLKSVRLNKGEKAKGWITFEVPQKSSGLKMSYNPFIVGTLKQDLKFDLGR